MIPPGWQLVPIKPNHKMTAAFAVEIRIQAGKLEPGTTQHEPLAPLWTAVLAASPAAPAPDLPRSAAEGWNAGVATLAGLAQASADALRDRLTLRPTRFNHAIEALDAIVEAASTLAIPAGDPADPAVKSCTFAAIEEPRLCP